MTSIADQLETLNGDDHDEFSGAPEIIQFDPEDFSEINEDMPEEHDVYYFLHEFLGSNSAMAKTD